MDASLNPMQQIAWRRGLFRVWVVLALLWIAFAGWIAYEGINWYTGVQTEGECWDRHAVWPDGQHFAQFDLWGREIDTPSNVDLNRKNHAWAADSIPERNRWVDTVEQKLKDCEAAWPITRRIALRTTDNWSNLRSALALTLLPPLALLAFAGIVGWVARGFRATT